MSFRYLEPEAFLALQKEVADKAAIHRRFLEEVQGTIQSKLVEAGIPAELESRVKALLAAPQNGSPGTRPGADLRFAGRASRYRNERNCYAALGVVHHIWHPVPGRFKDYIAMARPNLYQSLHTTVLHGGQPFEVQIRTQEMHHIAEEGVAAHWKYKSGKPGTEDENQRITWMRQLIEWSQEIEEPGEFLSTLKVDLAPVEVYAFTPKGRVLEFPRGATPVDFAYAVHTEVGHQCTGAKVNGQMVSLRHEITSGDVVEILTQKGHHPNRDWLSFVKSSHAKSKIRHWINLQEREEATEMGRKLLENEARHFDRSLKKIPEADLLKAASDYGLSKIEDLYAAVGFGKYSARQILTRVLGEPEKAAEPETADAKPTLVKTVKRMLGFGEAPLIVKGPRRFAGVPREVLQSHSRGRNHRLHHPRPRRRGAHPHLPQRAKLPVSNGTAHRCRVGRRKRRNLPGGAADPRARPRRTARRHHRGHQRRRLQHSQSGKPSGSS